MEGSACHLDALSEMARWLCSFVFRSAGLTVDVIVSRVLTRYPECSSSLIKSTSAFSTNSLT